MCTSVFRCVFTSSKVYEHPPWHGTPDNEQSDNLFSTIIRKSITKACSNGSKLLLLYTLSVRRPQLPQYQPIDRKKGKGKRVEDYIKGRAA